MYLPESIFDLQSYYDQKEENEIRIFELLERLMVSYEQFNYFLTFYIRKNLPKFIIKRNQYKDDKWYLDYVLKTHHQLIERTQYAEEGLAQFLENLCNCIDEYLKNAYKEMIRFLETGKISHKYFREFFDSARDEAHRQSIHNKAIEESL